MSRVASKHLDSGAPARWLRYASAGGVALASAGAYGDIIQITPVSLDGIPGARKISWRDLNNDGTDDILLKVNLGQWGDSSTFIYATIGGYGGEGIINKTQSQTITGGEPVGKVSIVGYRSSSAVETFYTRFEYGLPVGSRYFGVKLSGGQFGWIHVQLTTGALNAFESLSILSGAYNDQSGASIHVGTVPEPSSFACLGLLAAGAGGVFALKKFRKQQLIEEAKA
jgi:hypothetical protein